MTQGQVNGAYLADIPIDIFDSRRRLHRIRAVIDSGFDGELVLPGSIIRGLGLLRIGEDELYLPNGQPFLFNAYSGTIFWFNRERDITVLESETYSLVGKFLLAESHIEIDLTPGGTVTVTELPATF
ncbi:MAG: hypothetical protein OXI54_14590 [Chloroflexota bacterium]|nr:hypothetical protein [Chloroflexota bacterium]MDE2685354.1 hypothetical protein [Chloroflexota bacterium]